MIRVLSVEDNPADARLIQEFLCDSGYPSFEVVNGESLEEAKALLKEGNFDAVLLDLSLPDSFGLQTYEEIQAAAPRVPVVILTGNDDYDTSIEALQRGAQDYMIKSQLDTKSLVRAICYSIERKLARNASSGSTRTPQSGLLEVIGLANELFRHPINVIKGSCWLLQQDITRVFRPDPKLFLDRIDLQAQRLALIADEMHDIARLRMGEKIEPSKHQASVKELIETSIRMQQEVSTRCTVVTNEIDSELTMICDSSRLQRMFLNFFEWCFQNSPRNTEVRLMVTRDGDGVCFELYDEGNAILPNDGSQTDGRKMDLRFEVSRAIIEAHKGELKLHSERKQKKRLTFVLPLGDQLSTVEKACMEER